MAADCSVLRHYITELTTYLSLQTLLQQSPEPSEYFSSPINSPIPIPTELNQTWSTQNLIKQAPKAL